MMMMAMAEQAGPDVATALQWLALAAFAILAVACVVVLARQRRRRAMVGVGVALLVVALNHAAYYVAFLVFPDWLGALATMVWSIVLKLHVAGTGLLILWFAWKERYERR